MNKNLKLKFKTEHKVKRFEINIPIGVLNVEACKLGIHKIDFKETFKERSSLNDQNEYVIREKKEIKIISLLNDENENENNKSIEDLLIYLRDYFSFEKNTLIQTYPTICWSGICKSNSFTEKILKTLFNKIKPGMKTSYKELAELAGHINSQRAVGSVMRNNPICILIPCHRVINSNGKIGNYTGGREIKYWLLDHEIKYFTYFT